MHDRQSFQFQKFPGQIPLTKTTVLRLLFLKLKQKKNMNKYFFCFNTHKCAFLRVNLFFEIFFSVLALKTVDTQI